MHAPLAGAGRAQENGTHVHTFTLAPPLRPQRITQQYSISPAALGGTNQATGSSGPKMSACVGAHAHSSLAFCARHALQLHPLPLTAPLPSRQWCTGTGEQQLLTNDTVYMRGHKATTGPQAHAPFFITLRYNDATKHRCCNEPPSCAGAAQDTRGLTRTPSQPAARVPTGGNATTTQLRPHSCPPTTLSPSNHFLFAARTILLLMLPATTS